MPKVKQKGLQDRHGQPLGAGGDSQPERFRGSGGIPQWPPGPEDTTGWAEVLSREPSLEPAVRGVATRILSRVDRLKVLGNACVPEQAALAWRLLQ
jgi:hypothetical protein